jgi:hypothetical protein
MLFSASSCRCLYYLTACFLTAVVLCPGAGVHDQKNSLTKLLSEYWRMFQLSTHLPWWKNDCGYSSLLPAEHPLLLIPWQIQKICTCTCFCSQQRMVSAILANSLCPLCKLVHQGQFVPVACMLDASSYPLIHPLDALKIDLHCFPQLCKSSPFS